MLELFDDLNNGDRIKVIVYRRVYKGTFLSFFKDGAWWLRMRRNDGSFHNIRTREIIKIKKLQPEEDTNER